MTLPVSEALIDAIREAKYMNRDEGKISTVVLINPQLAERWYAELSIDRPAATDDYDPAPEVAGLRLIEDESIPVDEVCVLSDEDYLQHEYLKARAGD